MKKIFIFSILAVIIFSTCKKYEEGPALSFRSKKARIAGDWELVYYSESEEGSLLSKDTASALHFYYASSCSTYFLEREYFNVNSSIWTFTKDGTWHCVSNHTASMLDTLATNASCSPQFNTITIDDEDNGTWAFPADSNKRAIKVTTNKYFGYNQTSLESSINNYRPYNDWSIIELREKEMKWRASFYGYHGHLFVREVLFKKK